MLENTRGKQHVIIASPSQADPDYYFHWTRDSAITIRTLLNVLEDDIENSKNETILSIVHSYIDTAYHLQRLPNPSGDFHDLKGLGEPKFHVDLTAFDAAWGRPQRDGPALRAITILAYLSTDNPQVDVDKVYRDVVKNDLEYVARYWKLEDGFDLWEEVQGSHFFTTMVSLKAMAVGAQWAQQHNDVEFAHLLTSTFTEIKNSLIDEEAKGGMGFVSVQVDHIIETPKLYHEGARGGLDIATILAVLYTHNPILEQDHNDKYIIPFNFTDVRVLNSLASIIEDMDQRYPVNHNAALDTGVALGRYPEDVYNGNGKTLGNPWFLATAAASEFIYRFLYTLITHQSPLEISPVNHLFFQPITGISMAQGDDGVMYEYGAADFWDMVNKIFKYADGFLRVVKLHEGGGGHMSEQMNRYSGYMEGARDLTWSYGALWNAVRWRNKLSDLIKPGPESKL
ncbi:uncharacterized protein LODBEIA_P23320 [Lodderomyces beijingensis]|uniref:glucan 1,4-alpha-glucosidase n=1 Tax=Lodderomyces beijingensis TaxID=1775926 RepID=A0ABP0ZIZ4_9ASCO